MSEFVFVFLFQSVIPSLAEMTKIISISLSLSHPPFPTIESSSSSSLTPSHQLQSLISSFFPDLKSLYHFECALSLLSLPSLPPLPQLALSTKMKEKSVTEKGKKREEENKRCDEQNDKKIEEISLRLNELCKNWKKMSRSQSKEKEVNAHGGEWKKPHEKGKRKQIHSRNTVKRDMGTLGVGDKLIETAKDKEKGKEKEKDQEKEKEKERNGIFQRGNVNLLSSSSVSILYNCATSHLNLAWNLYRERERIKNERKSKRKSDFDEREEERLKEQKRKESETHLSLSHFIEENLFLAVHRFVLIFDVLSFLFFPHSLSFSDPLFLPLFFSSLSRYILELTHKTHS